MVPGRAAVDDDYTRQFTDRARQKSQRGHCINDDAARARPPRLSGRPRSPARKTAAGRYLAESTLAIGEIAFLLGYSEAAAFHRAFRRWYGATPEAFRVRGASR